MTFKVKLDTGLNTWPKKLKFYEKRNMLGQ